MPKRTEPRDPREPAGKETLRAAWLRMHAEGRRARDAAESLGVSEAELVASTLDAPDAGVRATALSVEEPQALVDALETLGVLKTQTRTASVVLEVVGPYPAAKVTPRLDAWGSCFAVEEGVGRATRLSLQAFDVYGAAIMKLFLLRESNASAFSELVHARRAGTPRPPLARSPDGERAQGEDGSTGAPTSLTRVLRALSGRGATVAVAVDNAGARHRHDLQVRRVTSKNDWLGVLDRSAKVLVHRTARVRLRQDEGTGPGAFALDFFGPSGAREATFSGLPPDAASS